MILKDKFYQITALQHEENSITATLQIDANHTIFDGHFPNNPVTPGVVEMEIIKEILATALDKTLKMKSMSSCKFLAILNPTETPEVLVNISIAEQEEKRIRINGQISATGTQFLKMGAEYAIL
ncbi:MAG: 3-hydroxyacyl-ACP dehydratase [Crocinitomicaceae bacterium]